MSYFKVSPLGIDTSQFTKVSSQSVARSGATAVKPGQAEGIAALERIKASWPKCAAGYLYEFADGSTRCSPWSNDYYLMVKEGRSPTPRVPDLSKVVPGSQEYFKWLCLAQGDGAAPHAVRMGFDKANLEWQATTDMKMRALKPPYSDPSRPKPVVPADMVLPCSLYVKSKGGNPISWRAAAYNYTTDILPQQIADRAPGGANAPGGKRYSEFRPSECKNRVPPDQVAACEAYVKSGRRIEDFISAIESGEMTQAEFDALTNAGAGRGGVSTLYLAAGAVGVVLLGAVLLKRRK